MHELGHQIGLLHSNKNFVKYADRTGYMARGYRNSDWPLRCFNGQNNDHLGWYDSRKTSFDPLTSGPKVVDLAAFADYSKPGSVSKNVLINLADNLYLQYNRAKSFNADTGEMPDQVTVVTNIQEGGSQLMAGLPAGQVYAHANFNNSGRSVYIKACERLDGNDGIADIMSVSIGMDQEAPCGPGNSQGGNPGNPGGNNPGSNNSSNNSGNPGGNSGNNPDPGNSTGGNSGSPGSNPGGNNNPTGGNPGNDPGNSTGGNPGSPGSNPGGNNNPAGGNGNPTGGSSSGGTNGPPQAPPSNDQNGSLLDWLENWNSSNNNQSPSQGNQGGSQVGNGNPDGNGSQSNNSNHQGNNDKGSLLDWLEDWNNNHN